MDVILKQDVKNLGHADDIVKVKNGYGRNFLIPQGMAILATESNTKIMAETLKQRAFKAERIKNEAIALSEKLKNITVKIGAKVGTSGKIFGSVNAIQIADAIKKQFNYEIDRKKITLDEEAIKEVGTYTAKLNLHREVSVTLNFEVIAE
ncbi:MAG: 50S ribosomal protein L9 [Bacteroidota bacterium]|nr:50S ribosomal protein L9 [Bacteroidota bacterium]